MIMQNFSTLFPNFIGLYNMSQVHNAPQLSAWCLYFMTTNYNKLCEMYPKEFKQINVTALKSIEEHRWPPVWYLKEQDAYRKASRELEIEKDKKAKSRRKRKCKSCFWGNEAVHFRQEISCLIWWPLERNKEAACYGSYSIGRGMQNHSLLVPLKRSSCIR